MNYELFMAEAYSEALQAFAINEVPIGCVIVFEDKIIGRGFNKRIQQKNVLYHAELIAIDEACKFMGDWRLEKCTLFVTVEPCAMCAGAILQSRIETVVFGTRNAKAGCAGSILNILDNSNFNHQVAIVEPIMQEACSQLMTRFFKQFRKKEKP